MMRIRSVLTEKPAISAVQFGSFLTVEKFLNANFFSDKVSENNRWNSGHTLQR